MLEENLNEQVKATRLSLKDFQVKTVDYVFRKLYKEGRDKMLIADEVGLGKTIVAKGIIAKAFSEFTPKPSKPTFNVIYICSNQALAKQNLKKLNFTGNHLAIDYSEDDDRLTGLAYISSKEEQQFPFRIKAFTPATSFDDKTHAGKADERILLYRLLFSYADLLPNKDTLSWILKGNRRIGEENWKARIRQAETFHDQGGGREGKLSKIRPQVFSKFRKELNKQVSPEELPKSFSAVGVGYSLKYWTLLRKLCQLKIHSGNYHTYSFIKELISSLRFILSRACLEYLQADVFVLDEFQRYKKLIDNSIKSEDEREKVSPAIQIARDIFSLENTKILMLSATPFKPYTNDFDEMNGEDHYNEFQSVLKFLMKDKTDAFWKEYEADRKSLFSFIRHPDSLNKDLPGAIAVKNKIEGIYRSCMVRTEKLLVSNDKDALIKQVESRPISIQPEDISDFIALDQITLLLNKEHQASLQVPIEYVKSSPFALSFLDNYQHKEKIRKYVLSNDKLKKLLNKTKHGWLNLDDISQYKPLILAKSKSLPNAKLRLLLDETVKNNGWKYLWIPPSVPYYTLSGAFTGSWGYSKTLIFSSWKLVPRMVASLVSYEAERLSIGNPLSVSEREKSENSSYQPTYFQTRRSPRPQFTFKVLKEEQEPQQMNNFILTYPCLFLSELYDPAINIEEKKELPHVKRELKQALIQKFRELDLNQFVSGEGDWRKWFWLAPLFFDKANDNTFIKKWFNKGIPPSELSIDAEDSNKDRDESNGREKHFETAKSAFLGNVALPVGKLTDDQLEVVCDHLADLAIGSPAVCYLRTQRRQKELTEDLLDASFNVASAFLTMFNKPESIAIVRLHTQEGDYWERALKYMIEGNIQAMLDEFVYLLMKGENIQSLPELSDFISDVLSVRTASTDTDDYRTFLHNLKKDRKKRKSLRSHYAVDFGTQKVNTAKGAGRQINIRQAFNSPFRPFVLASTSIGQEGLDFHFYCKKIFHWNLPSNPIDFEQREGRIHRYQGLVIRQNLAAKYKEELAYSDDSHELWKDLFKHAEKEKHQAKFACDLVPYWHTESHNDIKIERFVPLYPFSNDIEKYSNLIKVLTFYRLTFGQPRQEELVEALNENGFDEDAIKKLDELIINLSPISFLS